MNTRIYLRPLVVQDAQISYQWRNDPDIWKFTGSRPDRYITQSNEEEWIENVMKRPNEKRFAICIKETGQYIGNIQLTNLERQKAQYHIFIGEKAFWGKGFAQEATRLILQYAFEELGVDDVYLEVNTNNLSAYNLYKKIGFSEMEFHFGVKDFVQMNIHKNSFKK